MGTTKVIIGGKEYSLPPLNFKALKVAFPSVQRVMDTLTKSKGSLSVEGSVLAMEAAVDIIAAAMAKPYPEMTKEVIEEELQASEITGLTSSITDLLINSGLVKQATGKSSAGESQEAVSPSTATSTESSASSSLPDAKAEAGTE